MVEADESQLGLDNQVAELLYVSAENIKLYVECKERHKTLSEVIKERQEDE